MDQAEANISAGNTLGVVAWHTSRVCVDYREAEAFMRDRARGIARGDVPELVWFLEHPPVYTAGTSAQGKDLLDAGRIRVLKTGRGGQYTYHGPGQRIVYVMLDVRRRCQSDVRAFVETLQSFVVDALAEIGVIGVAHIDRVGIWVPRNQTFEGDAGLEDKIAAVGIRLMQWVSLHGISINVNMDLSPYDGIVPCGIQGHGITSLAALGIDVSMEDVDRALVRAFQQTFDVAVVAPDANDGVLAFL